MNNTEFAQINIRACGTRRVRMVFKRFKKGGVSLKDVSVDLSKFQTQVAQPVKETIKSKKAKETQPEIEHYVVVDHPQNNEIVSGLHYAIRIGASNTGSVELSINNRDWQPCRNTAGFWWFDWGYFTPGSHKITARLQDGQGKTLKKSAVVKCKVV